MKKGVQIQKYFTNDFSGFQFPEIIVTTTNSVDYHRRDFLFYSDIDLLAKLAAELNTLLNEMGIVKKPKQLLCK